MLDRAALRAGNVIVVDTDESAARLPEQVRPRAVVVPVGAGEEWFDAAKARATGVGTHPRVVFFGSFTPLQGTTTIARAISRLEPGALSFTLIGTGQDYEEVRGIVGERADVTWRDWVPGDQLPAEVVGHDVCLGIFGDTDKAVSVVPTKIYQGAAAGCALITSDTAAQRRALEGAAVLTPPGDPDALARALASLVDSPGTVERLQKDARSRAENFRSSHVVSPLTDVLRARAPGSGTPHTGVDEGVGESLG